MEVWYLLVFMSLTKQFRHDNHPHPFGNIFHSLVFFNLVLLPDFKIDVFEILDAWYTAGVNSC